MVKVGVLGHTGRLGKPLVEILNKHPYVEIIYTHSTSEPSKITLLESKAKLVFSALDKGVGKEYEHEWRDIKVIDLSIDHRYHPEWIYGLPEINREKIKDARYVANPGCYATSVILALAPLRERVSHIGIASNSGISGAGLKPQKEDNVEPYDEVFHAQVNEIEETLGLEGILFVPHKIYTADRGIDSTIFAEYGGSQNVLELFQDTYRNEPFVRLKKRIKTEDVIRTNFCDIKVLQFGKRIIVISALDNLIKGGSGQAVQNFNLMYGFDETTGLI